ncbi:MAG: tRNA lysidine(34) synthetase TilS [Brachymonas sp.]
MRDLNTDPLLQALSAAQPPLPLAVAYSGGADSSALLYAAVRLWPGQVQALHIHHGLQVAADDFARHCQQVCVSLQVPLASLRVQAGHSLGQSPEDAARRARYAALADWVAAQPAAQRPRSIALAQHADDQVETLLLALSRGAGLPGLAAMPAAWQSDDASGLHWCRPFLGLAGADLRAWLVQQDLAWVEDPTNQDTRYTRNRIRHELLPALAAAFPSFRSTFARSAAHCAQAQSLLDELAVGDLQAIGLPPRIAALQILSPARQSNVLRHWLGRYCGTQASQTQLAELQKQIAACRTRGHRIELKVGAGLVHRQGAFLGFD